MRAALSVLLVTLLALAAACDQSSGPDPGEEDQGDGKGDDPTPATGEATLEAYQLGKPLADMHVIFHHPDGSVSEERWTGADGRATAVITAGAFVTVYDRGLKTVAGLQPGDRIVVGPPPIDTVPIGSMAVYVEPFADATHYQVLSGCAATHTAERAPALEALLDWRCLAEDRIPLLVVAERGPERQRLAFAILEPAAKIRVIVRVEEQDWRTDWEEATVHFAGLPVGARAGVNGLTDGVGISLGGLSTAIGAPPTGRVLDLPPGWFDEFTVWGVNDRPHGTNDGSHSIDLVIRRTAIPDQPVDLSDLSPRLTAVAVEMPELHHPEVSWELAEGAPGGDFAVARTSWWRGPLLWRERGQWSIAFRPGAEQRVRYPALPDSLGDLRPTGEEPRASIRIHDRSWSTPEDRTAREFVLSTVNFWSPPAGGDHVSRLEAAWSAPPL